MSRRLPALVAALGLASALTVVTAPPTVAAPTQPQTLQFETTPPVGAAWWNPNSGNPQAFRYLAWATASSGLFPSYSIDPASVGVCWISEFPMPSPGIGFSGPGTCTIHVDQPGNDEYLPAPRVSQSFVIEKVQPELTVLRKTNSLTRKRTFSATLTVPTWFNDFVSGQWGYADQVVTFSVAGKPVCSGTTNAEGVATCTATLKPLDWLRSAFTATYAGDARYKPVSKQGPTKRDTNPVWPEL